MAIIPHPVKGNRLADELPGIYSTREFVYRDYRGEKLVTVGHPEAGDSRLIHKNTIDEVVGALAHTVQKDIISEAARKGVKGVVAVCALKGAYNFFKDFTAEIDTSLIIGYEFFMGKGWEEDKPLEKYTVLLDISEDSVRNQHLLIIEDIVDRGTSLYQMVTHLAKKGPAGIRSVALLDKPEGRKRKGAVEGIKTNYSGLIIDNAYVFGYGMDSGKMYRNLNGIYVMAAKKTE